jgi:hypothetical protein
MPAGRASRGTTAHMLDVAQGPAYMRGATESSFSWQLVCEWFVCRWLHLQLRSSSQRKANIHRSSTALAMHGCAAMLSQVCCCICGKHLLTTVLCEWPTTFQWDIPAAGVKPPPPLPPKRPLPNQSLPQSTALGSVPAATTAGAKRPQPQPSSQPQPQHIALSVRSGIQEDPLGAAGSNGGGLRSISTAANEKQSFPTGDTSHVQERDALLQHQQSSSQRSSDGVAGMQAAASSAGGPAHVPHAPTAPAAAMRDTAASTIDVRLSAF